MRREDLEQDGTEVWPDNWVIVDVFMSMMTQWRICHAGMTGLDYTALEAVMRIAGVQDDDRADVFAGIRIMEAEALRVIRDGRG